VNLDDVTEAWRSRDVSQLYGVDQSLLHQVLRQEQARLDRQRRRARWLMFAVNVMLLIMAALFFAILIDPNQPQEFSSRVVVWDYVVGVVAVAAIVTIAAALFAFRRSHEVRERGFGDSLRDHLRRRIAHLEAEATGERRLAFIMVVATLAGGKAITILAGRIKHVPVPWNDMIWPSPLVIVVILFVYLVLFRWGPRERQHKVQRKRELEALLKELDGQ
jgi:uncharacterized BrkB/YihY/UPF0761 family membrane protein